MKSVEIRDLAPAEIEVRIAEKKEELFKLRFQHTMGQLDNPLSLRKVRREIARLNTILAEKRRQADA
ncbi:MAG: 50S ribosomal protein L29 [Acidobacteria bacterium]|nr:MAG: 50S ribosomal protein L29 [Acidobacteriota bacterium]RLE21335.1 MAG: 50S ribosomal protein L29 [Acidobacteriota bacterium]